MSEPQNRLQEVVPPASISGDRVSSDGVSPDAGAAVELGEESVAASTPFVGAWRTLVSTTNWEKGRIIVEWRDALEASGAAATEYSDEAWAQLVGGVTGQHVGRLRRVHRRFGGVAAEYPGLYWSHFQAASEWTDAEMWLEGAVQNRWSVSQMRGKRWETVGAADGVGDEPVAGEAADVEPLDDGGRDDAPFDDAPFDGGAETLGEAEAFSSTVSDPADGATQTAADREVDPPAEATGEPVEPLRPFADLAELPADLADAFEQFKLAILTHKLTDWAEVSRADVLGALESLKRLATAPSD